jgi:type I restriction enzyme S subunit
LLFISEAKARSLSAYAVKEGDLVFSRVADVGRSVVVSEAEDGWDMSSNLMRISLDRTLVESSFAYLNIVHNQFTRRQIREFVNSGGREIATLLFG